MANLDEIRARVQAASAGPWQRHGADVWTDGVSGPLFRGRDGSALAREQADRDAEFVAHARDDILALLALVVPADGHNGPAAADAPIPPRPAAGDVDPRVEPAGGFF